MTTLSAQGLRRVHRSNALFAGRGNSFTALDGVDISISDGEATAVIGPSGSGKTTLLTLLLHLDQPTEGSVLLDGQPCHDRASLRRLRRSVAHVPQDPASSLSPRLSVRRQVLAPLQRLSVEGDHDRMVLEALERVGLGSEHLDRLPHQISGGQAQRVAIARALVARPRILLADEPTSGLDLPLRQQALDLLTALNRDQGLGLLLVTHDLGAALQTCDRGVVLHQGRIVEDAPVATLLAHPRHHLTRMLVEAIPSLDQPGIHTSQTTT